jgi:SanA protein
MTSMYSTKKRMVVCRLVCLIATLGIALPVIARAYIHCASREHIYSDTEKVPYSRVALVLGAGIRPDGQLSVLLKDRVDAGIRLYKMGKVDKLLMSGDNRVTHYNEPMRMRDYAVKKGIPAEDVAMDFAGRRTYDSIYRGRHIFGLREMIVVSQGWHLDRALYLCDHVGVKAWGFAADVEGHEELLIRLREVAASLMTIADVHLRNPKPVMGKRERI